MNTTVERYSAENAPEYAGQFFVLCHYICGGYDVYCDCQSMEAAEKKAAELNRRLSDERH